MKIFFPKEQQDELRTSIVPLVVQKLVALKLTVFVEEGVGETVSLNDDVYVEAGAKITKNRIEALSNADIVCRLNVPNTEEIKHLKNKAIHISFLDPFNQKDLIDLSLIHI